VDVVVIGAGVIGCAVAHELARRDARVRVVDPRPVGGGATHASAGMLAPYSEGHHAALLKLGLASLALWDPFVDRLRAESTCPFHYERSGTLQVATGSADVMRLSTDAAAYAAQQVPHQWMDQATLREFEPALRDTIAAGVFLPTQGYVDASAITRALADAAQQRGAHFTSQRVLGIHADTTGVAVTTSDGTLNADALVLAAGSWSSAIAGVTTWPPPVKPVRGQLLRLKAPVRIASRIVWGSACYVVPWPDGTTLVGATVEDAGFDEQPTAGGVRQLLNAVHDLLPATATAVFQEVRVGLRPKTPDELPIIGPSSTMRHVFHATGHYRNGILLTPLTAKLIGDLVLDRRDHDELTLTNPMRFGL
jgi:glycine oxidase